jgi:predicted O-methyltransferase YrrM
MSRRNFIYKIIKDNNIKKIAEIGVHDGNNALRMISSAGDDCVYYGFDLFELMTDEIFEKEVSKRPPTEKFIYDKLGKTNAVIKLYKGFSKDTLPVFLNENNPVDLWIIDGGHSVETVKSDWSMIEPHLTKDSYVLFDDYIHQNKKDNSICNRKEWGCNYIIDTLNMDIYSIQDGYSESFSWGTTKNLLVKLK